MLQQLLRGPDTVSIGEWIYVQENSGRLVGLVAAMLQARLVIDGDVKLVVRLLLTHCCEPTVAADSHELWSSRPDESAQALIRVENAYTLE